MSLLAPINSNATQDQAAEKMEALLLQKLIDSAHLLGKSSAPGASIHADMFAEALAEAVAHQNGGLGIAKTLEAQGHPGQKSSDTSPKSSESSPLQKSCETLQPLGSIETLHLKSR